MNIKRVNITFHVSDFTQAVSFYENTLGFQKKSQWPTYAVFDLCGIMLALEPEGERGAKRRTDKHRVDSYNYPKFLS